MRHLTNDVGIDFTCESKNEELKVLVINQHFNVNATNELETSKQLLRTNDHDNMNQENENENENTNDTDNIEDAIWNCMFFNANRLMNPKVISIISDNKVKVIECDVLNNNNVGNELEFDK